MTNPYRAMCSELLADYEQCRYRSELHDRARALLAQPVAQPPADGDVAELVAWLRESLDSALQSGNSKSIKNHCRLLGVLGRPTPQPVAVSERLPGDELCWWFEPDEDDGYGGMWTLLRIRGGTTCYTHWLPANALPTPTQ